MTVRKIKVVSTNGVSGTIETNVTTLGELKPLLTQREIDFSGMKLVVGETRVELSLDQASLPETDFKLYLMPSKTKSGYSSDISSVLRSIASNFEDLAEAFDRKDKVNIISASVERDSDVDDLKDLMEDYEY